MEDEELKQLLEENKILEEKMENQKLKMHKLNAHKSTIISAICGPQIQYYFPPRISQNPPTHSQPSFLESNPENYPLVILNLPEPYKGPLPFRSEIEFLNSMNSYKGIRVFIRSKFTKHSHKYEFYTTTIFRWEQRTILEITDSEGNCFSSFLEFARAFEYFPYNFMEWLGL